MIEHLNNININTAITGIKLHIKIIFLSLLFLYNLPYIFINIIDIIVIIDVIIPKLILVLNELINYKYIFQYF